MDTNQNPKDSATVSHHDDNHTASGRHHLRRALLGLGVGATVLVGAGTAAAALGDEEARPSSSSMMHEMRQMHESPAAREMHEQLPAELRAQMEKMHNQMMEMMEGMESSAQS